MGKLKKELIDRIVTLGWGGMGVADIQRLTKASRSTIRRLLKSHPNLGTNK